MNFGRYLPKHPKFFQSGIGTTWTKFLESPLWAPTIIRLFYVTTIQARREKNKETKEHKIFHILPILIVFYINKILYGHDNKIFHVNNS